VTGLAAVGLAALLLLGACKVKDPRPRETPSTAAPKLQTVHFDPATLERLGVRVEPAGSDSPAHRLQLPGTLEHMADRYAEVGTIVQGRVTAINVDVGDRVKKGQALATVVIPAILTAQADAISAQAALTVARDHAKREEGLLRQQLTTAREEELARGDATKAEAELAAASAKLKMYGAALPSASQGAPTGSMTLSAPFDGVVLRRNAVRGGFMEPNDTAFVVADPSRLWAVLDVYESDVALVRVGADVELHVDAIAGKTFRGRVAVLEPQLGRASRALRARVLVDNADGALRAGLFVRAQVPVPAEALEARLLLPVGAIQPLGERDVVFVERAPGDFEVRSVTVARRTSQLAEVTDGLDRGERVVVHGAFVLRGEAAKQ